MNRIGKVMKRIIRFPQGYELFLRDPRTFEENLQGYEYNVEGYEQNPQGS